MEFLVSLDVSFPDQVDKEKIIAAERAMAADLMRDGKLLRAWRVPARNANWTLWNVRDADELHAIFTALPAFPYFQNLKVHPLAGHPADPSVNAS